MKALQINQYGGVEIINSPAEAPKPSPQAGQVLVEVHAACLNPFDLHIREGRLHELIPLAFPATLGGDFAGVVVGLGEGVSEFKLGDEVYGQASVIMMGGTGTLAEYTAAQASRMALKPKRVDMQQASAMPLVGTTAIQAIEEHIDLQKGQKILIHGGAGGSRQVNNANRAGFAFHLPENRSRLRCRAKYM